MRKILSFIFLALAAELFAQQAAFEEGRGSFRAVDIYVDSKGTPLAAYQIEFSCTNGLAKIVGIEGGEHPAFKEAPFYDAKAMQHERVIIAAFTMAAPDQLPAHKTRIATIHVQIVGQEEPRFYVKLQTAGNADGKRISAEVSFEERK